MTLTRRDRQEGGILGLNIPRSAKERTTMLFHVLCSSAHHGFLGLLAVKGSYFAWGSLIFQKESTDVAGDKTFLLHHPVASCVGARNHFHNDTELGRENG